MNIYNFSAGPAMIFPKVLQKAQSQLLNWNNLGVSVMEISHRGEEFSNLARQSIDNLRILYHIPENYEILFLSGGARGQFSALPLNLATEQGKALYLISGYWSQAAADQAKKHTQIDEIYLFDDTQAVKNSLDFTAIAEDYDYVHYCPNETISGIELFEIPQVGNAVLVGDFSSTILSRTIDISRFGIIYAGAQKNLGIAGITVVIIRRDLLERKNTNPVQIWDYRLQAELHSMVNTPPTFAWYLCHLVFEHLLDLGGLAEIERKNKEKAQLLYQAIDDSKLFYNDIAKPFRSRMNVSFSSNNESLDAQFIETAKRCGLIGLKGHKISGGMRASIYNAMSIEGVRALIDCMKDFERAVVK